MLSWRDLEARLDVIGDLGLGEIDQMRFLAIGAATQLPHDGEALALGTRRFPVVAEVEDSANHGSR